MGMKPESWTESQPGEDFLIGAHLSGEFGAGGGGASDLGRHHLLSHLESVSACLVHLGGDGRGKCSHSNIGLGGETLKML